MHRAADCLCSSIPPQVALQTWDGKNYRCQEMFEGFDVEKQAEAGLDRHIRSMPNCPARLVKIQVIAEYHGEHHG